MAEVIKLPYRFNPWPHQEPFLSYMYNKLPEKKRAVLIWHRRAGKDKVCFNWLVMYALLNRGTYYYLFPSYSQGRKALWDNIDNNGMKLIDHVPKPYVESINQVQMKIQLKNGSFIQIVGTDNYDAVRGVNIHGCVFSEYAEQDRAVWETVIRPVVDANGAPVVFNFTPKGQNHAKELYDKALTLKDWFVSKLAVSDTGIKSPEQMQEIRDEGMSEDMIQQEWYVSFNLGIHGSYYAKYMQTAREERRVGKVPYDPGVGVYTSTDRGFATGAIVWFQMCGQEIHIIDYFDNQGTSLSEQIKIIKNKPYSYIQHFAPHDFDIHEYNLGMSARETGLSLGIEYTILPREHKLISEEGIEAVRSLFPRIWIDDEKCKQLIKSLENYKREYNEKREAYGDTPYKNWASHGADAVRYMAMGINRHIGQATSVSTVQSDMWRQKHNPRFS